MLSRAHWIPWPGDPPNRNSPARTSLQGADSQPARKRRGVKEALNLLVYSVRQDGSPEHLTPNALRLSRSSGLSRSSFAQPLQLDQVAFDKRLFLGSRPFLDLNFAFSGLHHHIEWFFVDQHNRESCRGITRVLPCSVQPEPPTKILRRADVVATVRAAKDLCVVINKCCHGPALRLVRFAHSLRTFDPLDTAANLPHRSWENGLP